MAVKKGAEYERTMKPSERKALDKKRNGSGIEGHDVAHVDRFPDYADLLKQYCTEYRQIAVQAKALEERRKELSEIILAIVDDTGMRAIYGDDWKARKTPGSNTSLSETKLLELGVDMDTIEAARVKVKYEYLQVVKYEPGVEDAAD